MAYDRTSKYDPVGKDHLHCRLYRAEPDQAPNLKQIRHLAFTDLDDAMRIILKDTLDYLDAIKGEVDDMTRKTYEFYMKHREA